MSGGSTVPAERPGAIATAAPRRYRWLAVACTLLIAYASLPPAGVAPAVASAGADDGTREYPRIANLYGYWSSTQARAFSRYSLVVSAPLAGSNGALQSLKEGNAATTILAYFESAEADVPGFDGLSIYPGWWLTLAGTTLAAPLDDTSTTVSVTDGSIMAQFLWSNPDVLVDGESMHVTAVNGNTLTVQRGYNSTATSHSPGARIAAHATAWPGAWMLNATTYCPTNPATGQTWVMYLTATAAATLAKAPWDGIFLDSINPEGWAGLNDGALDANNDNVADGGEGPSGTGWGDGVATLVSGIHALAPSAVLVTNGGFLSGSTGEELEHFNGAAWSDQYAVYASLAGPTGTGPDTIVNADTNNTGTQSLQAMRFYLATALMGNGYYAYDSGSDAHGQTWWYDEYDDGAGSSLPSAISASQTSLSVATGTGGRFAAGNVVLVPDGGLSYTDEQMLITAISGDQLTVRRGFNNSTAVAHPALSKVMTTDQLGSGLRWLGRPVGPARYLAGNLLRRDFANGVVLLNATSSAQTVTVGSGFRHIAGTQDPALNNGADVSAVLMIPAQDAVFLVRANSGSRFPFGRWQPVVRRIT